MRKYFLRNMIAIIVLVVVVFAITNYASQIQQQIGVKGASTSRAQGIAGQIGSDVGTQINTVKKQAMHISLSDIINGFSRFQRIPQDINDIKKFVQDQISSMLQSRNKK